MGFKLDYTYNWYKTKTDRFLIKTYYINGIAFTFNELPEIAINDPDIIEQANDGMLMTPEYFFLKSFYLIEEEAHPCLYELELENPELLEELEEI